VDSAASNERAQRFEREILVHFTALYRAALRLTGQVSDAEDLVQETCLRAFKCLDQLRHPAAAKVWAFSILCSIYLRQEERQSVRGAQVRIPAIMIGQSGRS
jgi:RNA polymerase sigma-70 factor, ECF subfamily